MKTISTLLFLGAVFCRHATTASAMSQSCEEKAGRMLEIELSIEGAKSAQTLTDAGLRGFLSEQTALGRAFLEEGCPGSEYFRMRSEKETPADVTAWRKKHGRAAYDAMDLALECEAFSHILVRYEMMRNWRSDADPDIADRLRQLRLRVTEPGSVRTTLEVMIVNLRVQEAIACQ